MGECFNNYIKPQKLRVINFWVILYIGIREEGLLLTYISKNFIRGYIVLA
ncbi:hypothetical protein IC582_010195 [Cucumis melo]